MLRTIHAKNMYTVANKDGHGFRLYVLDNRNDEWEFTNRDIVGMRCRGGLFEVDCLGTMIDHRFVLHLSQAQFELAYDFGPAYK
jgi:hypothetical protein